MKETRTFRRVIYLSFLLLFFGCSAPKNDIVEISPEYFVDEQLSLSDIADDIKYIPLDSKVLIPFINDLEMTDSLIFVKGGRGTGVMAFDQSGSFIRIIGNVGKGPGEYLKPSFITLNKIGREVYVNDYRKTLVYNFNGNFLRTFNESASALKTLFKDDKLYSGCILMNSLRDNPPYYWIVRDKFGHELYSKKNTTTGFQMSNAGSITTPYCIYKYNDRICYWNQYNDTIFEIEDTIYRARYLFKKDQYRLTPEVATKSGYIPGQDQHFIPIIISESQHYLFIIFSQNKKENLCIYNKTKNEFKSVAFPENKRAGINNDLDAGLPLSLYFPLHVDANQKEYLITSVDAFQLKAHVASEAFKNSTPKFPEKKKALEKLANSLNENDNPVLVLVKLKE